MRHVIVDGTTYRVGEPTQDPARRTIWLKSDVVGYIVRFGENHRLLLSTGVATNALQPRTDEGIDELVRILHAQYLK